MCLFLGRINNPWFRSFWSLLEVNVGANNQRCPLRDLGLYLLNLPKKRYNCYNLIKFWGQFYMHNKPAFELRFPYCHVLIVVENLNLQNKIKHRFLSLLFFHFEDYTDEMVYDLKE